jgi:long-subunit fatty acid transport protein
MAQTSTNSPYTRYGFGQLSDQSFASGKAMGGIGYGLRNGLQINATNPASYSAVDSLTFLFDAGMSLQNANFKENGTKTNAKNSSLDYLAMQFRLAEGLGFTAGFLPYSTVGYKMSSSGAISEDPYGNEISGLSSHNGTGGLQQVFIGLGYEVLKNLSVGANFYYVYGDIAHTISTTFNNTNAFTSLWSEEVSVKDLKIDFGAQYTQKFGKKHAVTLGAVYSLGKDMNSDAYRYLEKYNGKTLLTQTIDTLSNVCAMPHTLGVGLTYTYSNRLTVGLDYTLQKWADVKFPNTVEDKQFLVQEGLFTDRKKVSFGAEYIPNPISRSYLSRIRYRIGAHYADPYAKVDGKEGAREYGASFGFGFPLFQSKSILNVFGQYVKVSPKVKGMLEENYLKVNVGLTFNERWFMKWKVD